MVTGLTGTIVQAPTLTQLLKLQHRACALRQLGAASLAFFARKAAQASAIINKALISAAAAACQTPLCTIPHRQPWPLPGFRVNRR